MTMVNSGSKGLTLEFESLAGSFHLLQAGTASAISRLRRQNYLEKYEKYEKNRHPPN